MRNEAYLDKMNNYKLTLAPDDFFDRLIWHAVPEWGIDEDHFEEDLWYLEKGYKTYEQVAVEWGLFIVTIKFIMRRMWIR